MVSARTLMTSLPRRSANDEDGHSKDNAKHSAETAEPDNQSNETETDLLDSVFDMLNLPEFGPKDSIGSRISDGEPDTYGNDAHNGDNDIDMQDLFKAIDRNKHMDRSSAPTNNKRQNGSQNSTDPMDEFEKILSDLAADDAEVFRSDNPAPLFWDKAAGKSPPPRAKGSGSGYLDNLGPETLFETGPLASSFSAGTLTGNPKRISKIAARIVEDAKLTQHVNEQREPKNQDAALSKREKQNIKERELNQLGKLSQCRSITSLSTFVYEELLPKTKNIKSGFTTRPSPVVFADAIRTARELRAPQIALFIYNFCRTRMELVDRLQVLDSSLYEELLATTWNSQRDISGVVFLLQDAIAMGVVGSPQLERQVDQIVAELRKLYNMDNFADQISALKNKISPRRSIEDPFAHKMNRKDTHYTEMLKRFSLNK
ncbi:hypothetical protein IWW45_002775 [Coemansia sp. RSA 485]|nr:hypothetical protein IWW45_002775 [Coemansia sp. RSA 485]